MNAENTQGRISQRVENITASNHSNITVIAGQQQQEAGHLSHFKTSNYKSYKNDLNPPRTKNTCTWVLDHPHFTRWRDSDKNDLLWVSADPGCGKSVLSRAVVDEKLVGNESTLICHFFFKDNSEQNEVTTALCALLHQLFNARNGLLKYADTSIKKNGLGLRADREELWELLQTAAADPFAGEIVCVLDALDECQPYDRTWIIETLKRFFDDSTRVSRDGSRLKFFVTSRPYYDIERGFSKLTRKVPMIRLAGEKESHSISLEISLVAKEMVAELDICDEAKKSLITKLGDISNQTYLWLRLVLKEIENSIAKNPNKLVDLIDALPQTVEEEYEKLLQKYSQREEARKVLQIVLAAQRPLTLREMDVALEIKTSEPTSKSYKDLNLEGDENRKTWIRNICGLFVTVTGGKVHFIHQSAKEFLLLRNDCNPSPERWGHSFSLQSSHQTLAWICITHLLFEEFDNFDELKKYVADSDSGPLRNRSRRCSLLGYSAAYWITHFREACIDEPCLIRLAAKLCHPGRIWMTISLDEGKESNYRMELSLAPRSHIRRVPNSKPGALYLAVLCGLDKVVQFLLNDTEPTTFEDANYASSHETAKEHRLTFLNHRTGSCGSALRTAICRDQEEAKTLLVRDEAYFNTQGRYYGYALQAATRGGHEKIVKCLLDAGTDVNINDDHFDNALHAAAANGHNKIVKYLLDAGADVSRRSGNALEAAARAGHDEIVKYLLDAGADVSGRRCNSALKAATAKGHKKIVKYLLDAGADVSRHSGNALEAAAGAGHDEIIKYLLDAGADMSRRSGNAVEAAAGAGHDEIVKCLLDAGADVSGRRGDALKTAAGAGYDKIVKYLLDAGADVSGRSGNALQAAAAKGHKQIVKCLLDAGADINLQGGCSGNALQAAATGGHDEIVKFLLDAGADVNIEGGRFGNALQAAAAKGHKQIVECLLDAGADINLQGGRSGNALQAAVTGGHDEIVKFLLDAGADVNAQGGRYGNALQAASSEFGRLGRRARITDMLLESGADVNARGGYHGSALQAAIIGGKDSAVGKLLQAGARIVDKNKFVFWENTHTETATGNALLTAVLCRREKALKQLLEYTSDVDPQTAYTDAIQAAVSKGYQSSFSLLMEKVMPSISDKTTFTRATGLDVADIELQTSTRGRIRKGSASSLYLEHPNLASLIDSWTTTTTTTNRGRKRKRKTRT